MKRLLLGSSAVGLVALPFVVACGDDGGTGGSGTSTSTVTGPTNSVTSSSSSTSTSTSTTNSSTSSGSGQCTELSGDQWERIISDVDPFFFYQANPPLGGPEEDVFRVEFYGDLNTITGSVDLGSAPNNTYETCETCVFIGQDLMMDQSVTYFFAAAGTLELGTSSPPFVNGTLTDVTLIEVTIDQTTFVTTPVENGDCYHVASVPIVFEAPPGNWACDPLYFGTNAVDDCDCGCAATDTDCPDMTAAACDYCINEGSCAEMAGDCTPINAANNAVCN